MEKCLWFKTMRFFKLIGSRRSMSLSCSASLPHRVLSHQASLWRPNVSCVSVLFCSWKILSEGISLEPWGRSACVFTFFIWGKITFLFWFAEISLTFSSHFSFCIAFHWCTHQGWVLQNIPILYIIYNCKCYCKDLCKINKHDDIRSLNNVQRLDFN